MRVHSSKQNKFSFISILFLLILIFVGLAFFSLYLSVTSNLVLYKFILNIILIIASLMSIYILMNAIYIIRILKGKKISSISRKMVRFSIGFIYPKIIHLSTLLGLDKDGMRGVFSELNNRIILSETTQIHPEEILILLPHCLQKSHCPHKVTGNIENCKRCGLCDIDRLIELKKKYGTQIFVATGGTLARKIIKDLRPKGIIAVACERDLSSGILEVRQIPVIGVLNDRPEGPCVNTKVDIDRIEKAIKFFIGEGE